MIPSMRCIDKYNPNNKIKGRKSYGQMSECQDLNVRDSINVVPLYTRNTKGAPTKYDGLIRR